MSFFLTAHDFLCILTSSFFGNKKGVMMLAGKLLELADLVGLSQSDIARHFGITRTQVNLWARNKRLVPKRYRAALVTLVTEEMQRCIDLAAHQPMALGALGKVARIGAGMPLQQPLLERLLAAIHTLRDDWLAENRERHGLGPTTSIGGVLEALDVYKTMSPEEMRKPASVQRLQVLSDFLQECATVLNRIGPMQDIVEEKKNDVDNDHSPRQPHQPGDAGATNASHHSADGETLA
jgi:transcriptional regulator with XRE-family HTH domain